MKKYVSILIVSILFVCITDTYSQLKIQAGPYVGIISYMGDLAPLHIRGTTASAMFSGGLFGSISYKRYVRADVYLGYGKLGADDNRSTDESRIIRNLNFESHLWHWGVLIHTDFTALIFKQFHPTIFLGIGQFRYNPFTFYEGEKIMLHPLRTEGQGQPGHPQPYKLTEWQIPFGFELGWRLNNNFEVSLAIATHATKTDYIDDVSNVYADPVLLLNTTGELAEILAYRADELDPDKMVHAGSTRGNPSRDDWYMTAVVKVARTIQFRERYLRNRVKCPK